MLDLPENLMQTVDFTVWELALLRIKVWVHLVFILGKTSQTFKMSLTEWVHSTNAFSKVIEIAARVLETIPAREKK